MKTNDKRGFQAARVVFVAVTLHFLAVFVASVSAQSVPSLVNYQGRLSNPDGTPLATADYMLTFNICDTTNSGAQVVWGPQIFDSPVNAMQGHGSKIPVVQGYFNVMLGPVDTIGRSLSDAFSGSNRFVEITVSNRPPISPRQQILAAPFAFQAGNAERLAGYDWSAVFGTNNPVVGQISTAKLSDGAVTLEKLASRPVGTNVSLGGLAVSASTANWSNVLAGSGPYEVAVTNLTVRITTSGRPVHLKLMSSSTNTSYFFCHTGGGASDGELGVIFLRDGQRLNHEYARQKNTGGDFFANPSRYSYIDSNAAAAPHTYEIHLSLPFNASEVRVFQSVLVAYEL